MLPFPFFSRPGLSTPPTVSPSTPTEGEHNQQYNHYYEPQRHLTSPPSDTHLRSPVCNHMTLDPLVFTQQCLTARIAASTLPFAIER